MLGDQTARLLADLENPGLRGFGGGWQASTQTMLMRGLQIFAWPIFGLGVVLASSMKGNRRGSR